MTIEKIRLNIIQEKFWMDDLLKSPSTEYNDPNHTFIVRGNLSLSVLEQAYRKIMEEYPPFCSTIEVENNRPFFIPQTDFKVPFHVVDIDGNMQPSSVDQFLSELVNVSFDLQHELPCRFYCIRKGDEFYLLHSFHHVVMDGMSVRKFFDRLTVIYNQLLDNEYVAVPQSDLLLQFNSFLQDQYIRNNKTDAEYWRQYIDDVPVNVSLPQAVYNKEVPADTPNTWRFQLGKDLDNRVKDLCSQQATTHFRVYSAVWAMTLSKVLNIGDLAIDHALNMRPKEIPLLGVFVNNYPIRYRFDTLSDATFVDVLNYTNDNRLNEQQHLYALYGDYLPKSQNSMRESFNFSINYPLRLEELSVNFRECKVVGWRHVNTNVSPDILLVLDADEHLTCDLRYKQNISLDYVKMLANTFGYILRQVADNPYIRLSEIRLVSEQQQQTLLAIEEKHLQEASLPEAFPSLFRKIVVEQPDHQALVCHGITLSYAELDRRSDIIAKQLVGMGIANAYIGISLPKSIDMIVAMLAILKSGNAYVPIGTDYPQERIDFIVNDVKLSIVFTDDAGAKRFSGIRCLNASLMADNAGTDNVKLPSVASDDTAYVIYTSGTTGTPKGVPIKHSMLSQTIKNNIAMQKMTRLSRVIQFANIVFDASVVEIFPALSAGATLYLPSEEERKDSNLLVDFLTAHQITSFNIPPVLLLTLPHVPLPDLKTIVVGGDVTSEEAIRYWSKDRLFINAYGPTENCVDVTYNVVNPDSAVNDIGTSMAGVTSYVLDCHSNLVPDYAIGELCIGGVKLSDGYLNRPDLNRVKFITNPFASDEDRKNGRNLRLYKTCDLVTRTPDGHLLFLGRSDNQVKLNGFRIELGEVESKIVAFGNGIKNAVAMIRDNNAHKMLVAYILVPKIKEFDLDELKQYLHDHLPSYMIPAVIVPLEKFPHNASGKVDRRKLPLSLPETNFSNYSVPTTLTEKRLVKIWGELLDKEFIDRNDSFIYLGGDSISVIKLVYQIHKHFGISIHASDVYDNPTLAALANLIDSKLDNSDESAEKKILDVAKEVMKTEYLDVDTDLFEAGMDQNHLELFVNKSASRANIIFTTFDVLQHKSIRNLIANIDRNLYFWSESADDSKPVVMYFNGFVESYPYNVPVITSFEEYFSVFNVESIFNFFINRQEVSLDILLKAYEDIFMVALKDKKVFALLGYCIGSEIAIAFAIYMKQRHPDITLRVLNLDAVYDRTLYCDLNLELGYVTSEKRFEIFNKVYKDLPRLDYDGPIVNIMVNEPTLLETREDGTPVEPEFNERSTRAWKENLENWQNHYPNAPWYMLDSTHLGIRERKEVRDRIKEILKQCWNI